MKKTTIYFVMALLCLNFCSLGQVKTSKKQTLKIGDKVPDDIWSLPISVMNHPTKRAFVTLNEFKGKLIGLYFWNTECVDCVVAFPKITGLNKEFENRLLILPVTKENRRKVKHFEIKNEIVSSNRMLSIVNDKELASTIPHSMLFKLVWVLPDGTIGSIVDSSDLSSENINLLIYGNESVKRKRSNLFKKEKLLNMPKRTMYCSNWNIKIS